MERRAALWRWGHVAEAGEAFVPSGKGRRASMVSMPSRAVHVLRPEWFLARLKISITNHRCPITAPSDKSLNRHRSRFAMAIPPPLLESLL